MNKKAWQQYLSVIENELVAVLNDSANIPKILQEAMHYVVLAGGKRIRPLLTVAGGLISAADFLTTVRVGAAIELIHTYSLVHDDLPAMDDDKLRRGMPTCHIKYNEVTAILVGDALQSQAFAVLSSESINIPDKVKLQIINLIAKAIGASGMVGGQFDDVMAVAENLKLNELQQMHQMKTGVLIEAALLSGYLSGKNYDQSIYKKLRKVANQLGLLFQIIDDILDVTQVTETLGKTANKDLYQNKATYVRILGLNEASKQAATIYDEITKLLKQVPNSELLQELATFVYQRNS